MTEKTIEITADMPEAQAASLARQMFHTHLEATDKDLTTFRLHGIIGEDGKGMGKQYQFVCDIAQPFNSALYNKTATANKVLS